MVTQIRTDSKENWISKNPILLRGEPGFEADTQRLKIGDGITQWVTLPYSWLIELLGSSGGDDVPSTVISLDTSFSTYHQASQVALQGTFHTPTEDVDKFRLRFQFSGEIAGGEFSGIGAYAVVGIPAAGTWNCGGIVGDEVSHIGTGGPNPGAHDVVGTAIYPTSSQKGVLGCLASLGTDAISFGMMSVSREVIYDNTHPDTDLTVQILVGESSGADFDFLPPGYSTNVLGPMAVGSNYDTNSRNDSALQASCCDLWVVDYTANALHRFSVGRRPLAKYHGVQERLLWRDTLTLSGQVTLYGGLTIDKNGILAVYSPTANTVTLVDTKANFRAGKQLVTTASLGAVIDNVKAAPDGSGFWCAVDNTSLVKIHPTTGAVLATVAITTPGSMNFVVSNDGSVAYIWSASYGGIKTVNLTTSAVTDGPLISTVGPMALSADGLSLVLAASAHTTWVIAKIPINAANASIASATTIKYSQREGVGQIANYTIYSLVLSADGKMWFAAGAFLYFAYGWVSDASVFDGQTADTVGGASGFIAVTDNDGIYLAYSGGTSYGDTGTLSRVWGYPGSTFKCDPVFNGADYMEVLAS